MYEQVGALPVIQSLRSMTASVIEATPSPYVFSIGIGDGVIYSGPLADKLKSGGMKLLGVDISQDLLVKCSSALDTGRAILQNFSPESVSSVSLIQADILDIIEDSSFDEWAKSRFSVIEAGLVLHHIFDSSRLISIFNKISDWLAPGGVFVLADIDVAIGEYLESKEKKLKRDYENVERDNTKGVFVCSKDGRDFYIPVLDVNDDADAEALANLDAKTCRPLLEEAKKSGKPQIVEFVEKNIKSARQGNELHRAAAEWERLIREGFKERLSKYQIFPTEEIKAKFPDVLDSPFVALAYKR